MGLVLFQEGGRNCDEGRKIEVILWSLRQVMVVQLQLLVLFYIFNGPPRSIKNIKAEFLVLLSSK